MDLGMYLVVIRYLPSYLLPLSAGAFHCCCCPTFSCIFDGVQQNKRRSDLLNEPAERVFDDDSYKYKCKKRVVYCCFAVAAAECGGDSSRASSHLLFCGVGEARMTWHMNIHVAVAAWACNASQQSCYQQQGKNRKQGNRQKMTT